MSEYRHIANLTGPQGERGQRGPRGPGLEASVELTSSDVLEDLEPGFYHVTLAAVSEALGLPGEVARSGSLEVLMGSNTRIIQRFTATDSLEFPLAQWQRGSVSSGKFYEWKQTYPQRGSISRGTLDDGTDIDTLRLAEHEGVWHLSSGHAYESTPISSMDGTDGGILSLSIGNPSVGSSTQTLTIHPRGGEMQLWHRKLRFPNPNTTAAWEPWVRLARADELVDAGIQSPGIARIITSTDPNEPLQDGDLLLVLEG